MSEIENGKIRKSECFHGGFSLPRPDPRLQNSLTNTITQLDKYFKTLQKKQADKILQNTAIKQHHEILTNMSIIDQPDKVLQSSSKCDILFFLPERGNQYILIHRNGFVLLRQHHLRRPHSPTAPGS